MRAKDLSGPIDRLKSHTVSCRTFGADESGSLVNSHVIEKLGRELHSGYQEEIACTRACHIEQVPFRKLPIFMIRKPRAKAWAPFLVPSETQRKSSRAIKTGVSRHNQTT